MTKFGVCMVYTDQVAGHIARVTGVVHFHVHTSERVCVQIWSPFPYLGNGWTDCAKIWHVARDQLARLFTEVDDGVQLHVRTCATLFRISGTAGRIALKFGVWLWDQQQCVLYVLRAKHIARAQVPITFQN